MRRFLWALFILLILPYNKIVWAQPDTTAQAAVLMEAESKRVLFSQNPDQPLAMASTTKIMTAMVALAYGDLDDTVTVAERAAGLEGSSMYLKAGEEISLEDLLYGLMLRSGNDAAAAIAIHVAGSEAAFVDLMNGLAYDLGALHTHFENPHGLPAENHVTSAYDLALLTAYAMEDPRFVEIVSARSHVIESSEGRRTIANKNKLLKNMEGANGVKTGYTKQAGRCFVGSAPQGDMTLVGTVLNCGPMFEECESMLEYGFANYHMETVMTRADAPWRRDLYDDAVLLAPMRDLRLPVGEGEEVVLDPQLPQAYLFPDAGLAGNVTVRVSGAVAAQWPLYAHIGEEAEP